MTLPDEPAVRAIGGFDVIDTRTSDLIALLQRRRGEGRRTELLFANTNFVVECQSIARELGGPETVIVNDGIGIDLAALLIHGRFFTENQAGTDFVPRFLAALDRPTRLFLLGARAPSVEGAAAGWSALPHVEIVGVVDGFDGMADADRLVAQLRDAKPDVLFVALGDPRQGQWIVDHRHLITVPLVMAVGAVFDFVSGTVPRAPRLVRQLRLEWLYRLLVEPRRLIKRYSVDLVVFFVYCVRAHRRERLAARTTTRSAA